MGKRLDEARAWGERHPVLFGIAFLAWCALFPLVISGKLFSSLP